MTNIVKFDAPELGVIEAHEAEQERIRIENERLKKEVEELKSTIEAKKAAVVPDKEKLKKLVSDIQNFNLPTMTTDNGKTAVRAIDVNFKKAIVYLNDIIELM